MKKLVLLASVFALILSSCTQDLPQMEEENVLQEVIFTSAIELKGDPVPNCDNPDPDYALLTINDGTNDLPIINSPVFFVNGIMYTQAIKLAPGTYTLEHMELYATGADNGNDLLVNAVPYNESNYGQLVTAALPATISVSPFAKTEVPVSILCYITETHSEFGFTWFRIEENTVKNKFFFGDFCTKFFTEYGEGSGSIYDTENYTVHVDMPAIFKMHLYYDSDDNNIADFTQATFLPNGDVDVQNELVAIYDNEDVFTNGTLAVPYPDMDGPGDLFKVDIFIYVKVGSGFEYVPFGSWYWMDDSDKMYSSLADLLADPTGVNDAYGFTSGTDGVYDFILGNCNVEDADFAFAPYMNLPGSSFQMVLSTPGANAYFEATLSGIGSGYDIKDETVDAFCFDLYHTINGSGTFTVHAYSSLYVNQLPLYMQNENWAAVNWLANNYKTFEGWTWQELQIALWLIEDNTANTYGGGDFINPVGPNAPSNTGLSGDVDRIEDMVEAATAVENANYQPMPGGWAAVVLEHTEGTQTIFTIVDP